MFIGSNCDQGLFYVGAGGGAQAPKCWPGPPNILVPTAKICIVKIYAIFVQWRNQHSYQLVHKAMMILLTKIQVKVQIKLWSLWHGLCAVCWLLYLSSLVSSDLYRFTYLCWLKTLLPALFSILQKCHMKLGEEWCESHHSSLSFSSMA